MTKNGYERINDYSERAKKVIDAYYLRNQEDRTLLYGYTCERLTWHVYLKDGVIHTITYNQTFENEGVNAHQITEIDIKDNKDYVPNKRVYPALCDFEFCMLLRQNGVDIPFTTYEEKPNKKFYGVILD